MPDESGWGRPSSRFPLWLKDFSLGSVAFITKGIHVQAFNSATESALDEVAIAIKRQMNGRQIGSLDEKDRLVVLTLQQLRDDMRRRLNDELASWPPTKASQPSESGN